MTLLSRTHHSSHRPERSLSRDPVHHRPPHDRSPLDYDYSGSISPPRKRPSQKSHERNGDSHRRTNWNYAADRSRERPRDRSRDRDRSRRYDPNGPRVPTRNRDTAYDDDLNERLPHENSSRKIDLNGHERSRQADCYRGGRPQRDHSSYKHYESYRSGYHEADSGSIRDRNERRDFRPSDQSSGLYSKDQHLHSSYDRHSEIRLGDYSSRSRPQNEYPSSSHHRQHYSPRAPTSPTKSPMRRPFKSRDGVNENDERHIKRRRLDSRLNRHDDENRWSSRSGNQRTVLTRSFTPSRSRSHTPSDSYGSRSRSKSPSRSRTRSRSNHRAKSRSCSRSHSTYPDYPPPRSPSPIPPLPPRPPKSKPRSRSQESDVVSPDLRSTSLRHSIRPSRRSRSYRRSRTPPPEASGSSLDGRPCGTAPRERSRSSRRTQSHSRRRSISLSARSGYSRTPSPRRSISRSRSAHLSSDRRVSSSSRPRDRSRSRSSNTRQQISSPRASHPFRSHRRRRVVEDELGPPPPPPRPPTAARFASPFDKRIPASRQQRAYSLSPLPPSSPPLRRKAKIGNDLEEPAKATRAHGDTEDAPVPDSSTGQAPLPVSPPPAIPKPPKSPKRLRSTVHSIRKAPGMPPIAPVAQTSAGVRRFFPGDDDEDEDEIAPMEPTKPSLLRSEEPEEPAQLNPKPPSPSPPPPPPPPPPLPPPSKSPRHLPQNGSSPSHIQQRAGGKLSQTPSPPPPPSAPPPPPPPLSPVEVADAALIAPSAAYNIQTASNQSKRQFSPRAHHYEGEPNDCWSTSSRKPYNRFSSRWHVRDVPPDPSKDYMHAGIVQPEWETNPKVHPTINNPIHQMALQPEVHPPTSSVHYSDQVPTKPVGTDSAYQILQSPSSASRLANPAFTPHQQFPAVTQPANSSSDPHTTVQTQVANGRRETKEIYERLVQVGEGTYGKVYKARNIETSELVAMKRIRMEAEKDGFPITAIREIKLLQGLQHPNIVNLVEMVVSKGHVYIVFEYMDHDLSGVLHHPSIHFTEAHTKSLMYQLLCGLQYMHEREVLHRDLKGSNILLNKLGQLKIADFGLARRFERGKEPGKEGRGRGRDYTNRVITLWYKPPELLFGATVYGEEVDMWSAGAIFLELFTRRPILQTADEIDQLHATFKLMGTPTEKNWPEAFNLPWFELFKPKVELPSKLRETFFGLDKHVKTEAGMTLAEKLLSLRPVDRPSARDALQFPYFTKESPSMEMPKDLLSNVKGEWHELESKRARRRKDI